MAISGDCCSTATITPQLFESNPIDPSLKPMRSMVRLAISGYLRFARVVISPSRTTMPVLTAVSSATRLDLSWRRHSSSTASEIWSHTLSGWPSVTDSEEKSASRSCICDVLRPGYRAGVEPGKAAQNPPSVSQSQPRIGRRLRREYRGRRARPWGCSTPSPRRRNPPGPAAARPGAGPRRAGGGPRRGRAKGRRPG